MKVLIYTGGNENLSDEQKSAGEEIFIRGIEEIFSEFVRQKGSIPAISEDVEISLTFVPKDAMADLNKKYREVEGPTDVLSFPMWEDEKGSFAPPNDWETLQLGDIVVCPDIVAKNAADNGKSFAEETALVTFHGCLHLIGYDHYTDERRDEMWREQDAMVAALFARNEDKR